MDEKEYKRAKTIAKTAGAVGSAVGVFADKKNTKDAGWAVGMGGGIANNAIGKGYTVDMKFKCM
jgi:hypothetical protein